MRAIDFGCAQYVEDGVPLTRKTGTPMFMVRFSAACGCVFMKPDQGSEGFRV